MVKFFGVIFLGQPRERIPARTMPGISNVLAWAGSR